MSPVSKFFKFTPDTQLSPIIESIGVSMAVLLLWIGGSGFINGVTLSSGDFLRVADASPHDDSAQDARTLS